MKIKFNRNHVSTIRKTFKHIIFFSGIFILFILADSNSKPHIYFDIKYLNEKKGPTQIFFSQSALDFTEDNSMTEILNLFGTVSFPVEKSALLKMNYLRLDPCSCDGEFQIQDWGLSRGFRKVPLVVDSFSPYYQVEIKGDRYLSTGFDPQLHSGFLNFSKSYKSLVERDYVLYLQLFLMSVAFYLLMLFAYKKFTVWRFVFIFPLLFTLALYFELRNNWKFLLFTYQQEGPGEALQAILILSATIISFYIFYKFKKDKKIKILHFAIGLVLLVLFLEETSYMQRVFLYETPDFIEIQNYQNETTIHNLAGVHEKTHLLYKIIGLYGAFSWSLLNISKIKKINFFNFVTPPKVTVAYYLLIFSFYFLWNNQYKFNLVIPNVQEAYELLLAFAILIYVVRNFYYLFNLKIEILDRLNNLSKKS
jgi:hypothetical protein